MARTAQPIRRPTGPPTPRIPNLMMRVWDAPTRLFHWAIVLLVASSYITAKKGWIDLHFLAGYAMVAMLLFRLVWGFVGSETSRFGKFLRSPLEGLHHLATFGRREPDREIGHNAAGGWMVLLMLAGASRRRSGTGLFSNADGDGLRRAAGAPPGIGCDHQRLGDPDIHVFNLFYVHAGPDRRCISWPCIAYAAVKRHDLVRPMVTGKKRLPANHAAAAVRQPRPCPYPRVRQRGRRLAPGPLRSEQAGVPRPVPTARVSEESVARLEVAVAAAARPFLRP